jgi:hypothetical protein
VAKLLEAAGYFDFYDPTASPRRSHALSQGKTFFNAAVTKPVAGPS